MIDRRMTRRRVLVTGASVVGVGIAGAIGASAASQTPATPGASPSASPSASPGASPAAGSEVELDAIDINWKPKEITIAANTDAKIKVVNKGVLQHNLAIDGLKIKSKLLNGGESETVTINAKAGTYEFYCPVPGHKEAGMVGKLIVK